MNRLRRFFNRNRIEIIVGVIIIAFIFLIVQIFNSFYNREDKEKINNQQENKKISIESLNEIKEEETTAIMTQRQVSQETTKNNLETIRTFVDKCNQGAIEEAYQMLSQDMRNLFYTSIEIFKQNYVNIIFTTKRTVDIEAWYTSRNAYTYKVTLYEDLLATGNASMDSTFEEYYAIVEENGENKLNLNKFIEAETIEKTVDSDIIKIEIKKRYKFKENEQYEINIRNVTDKRIAIDTLERINSMYLTGNNRVQYEAFSNEVGKNLLVIEPFGTGTYIIKFNKIYNPSVESKSITFSDIVVNYDNWIVGEEKESKSVTIEL